MDLRATLCGCNAVCYYKNYTRYGMTCAWMTMIDYDELFMLIGSQSSTGNNIAVGDTIGVSALAGDQIAIAKQLGEHHSDQYDKLGNLNYVIDGNAILIPGAKVTMKCLVKEVRKYGQEKDNMIIVQIVNSTVDDQKKFLDAYSWR